MRVAKNELGGKFGGRRLLWRPPSPTASSVDAIVINRSMVSDVVIKLWPCIIVSVVAALLYINTLKADFAYDDSRAIKTNQDLWPSSNIWALFRNDFWGTPLTHSGSHKSYRPLCVLSFRLNYYFGSLSPAGYHLGNLLLHSLVSGLFTYFASSTMFDGDRRPTLVAGLLFATHPIHTEAVAGVVGRADILSALFFLLSLLSYKTYVQTREKAVWPACLYLYGSLALAASSLLSKENGITVLAVSAVYHITLQHRMCCPSTFQLLSAVMTQVSPRKMSNFTTN